MPIRFNCYECGRLITVPDEAAGKRGRCPGCNSQQPVPRKSTVGTGKVGAGTGKVKTGGATAAKRKTGGANRPGLDADEIVPGMEDDEDNEDNLPAVELDDDLRSLIDGNEEETGAGTAAGGGNRKKKRSARVSGATSVALSAAEKREMTRAATRAAMEEMKKKQTGGRAFLWVVFGFFLLVLHTAGAILLGAMITLAYAENPKQHEWFKMPAGMLGVDEKIQKLRDEAGGSSAAPQGSQPDESGDPDESQPVNAGDPDDN
ncbi:MAG: hypothetical protein AB7K09_14345 [Planctomycetota bacterium]